MYIVLLKFSTAKDRAGQLMPAHKDWVKRGFDEGVFLLVGSLEPELGGAVLAHGISLLALRDRVNSDPFVRENVVTAEILEIDPSRVDKRLEFLAA